MAEYLEKQLEEILEFEKVKFEKEEGEARKEVHKTIPYKKPEEVYKPKSTKRELGIWLRGGVGLALTTAILIGFGYKLYTNKKYSAVSPSPSLLIEEPKKPIVKKEYETREAKPTIPSTKPIYKKPEKEQIVTIPTVSKKTEEKAKKPEIFYGKEDVKKVKEPIVPIELDKEKESRYTKLFDEIRYDIEHGLCDGASKDIKNLVSSIEQDSFESEDKKDSLIERIKNYRYWRIDGFDAVYETKTTSKPAQGTILSVLGSPTILGKLLTEGPSGAKNQVDHYSNKKEKKVLVKPARMKVTEICPYTGTEIVIEEGVQKKYPFFVGTGTMNELPKISSN